MLKQLARTMTTRRSSRAGCWTLVCSALLLLLAAAPLLLLLQPVEAKTRVTRECRPQENCRLPFCNCDSPAVPVDTSRYYKPFELPQLVVLTIDDDGLDIKSYQVYKKLLERLRNPNNRSIRATFFLSDSRNESSFCLINDLYRKRHEMAVSTVNHTCPNRRCSTDKHFQPWNYMTWTREILNMRARLNKYAGIPKPAVTGFRAPILEPAANMHYKIIAANRFNYDSSLITNDDSILYPFTLDNSIQAALSNNGPVDFFPGLWELPIATYLDMNNKRSRCLKLWEGNCKYEPSVAGVAKFFRFHFLRAYYKNRAPLVLHLSAAWLKQFVVSAKRELMPDIGFKKKETIEIKIDHKQYVNLDGLIQFVNETLQHNKDVYFVTAQQAIQWMQMLPRLEMARVDLARLVHDELFGGGDDTANTTASARDTSASVEFRGECSDLKQPTPDYDREQPFDLDDNFEEELRKRLKIEHTSNSMLAELQSEILFINEPVLLFLVSLFLGLFAIIIIDKYF